MSCPRLALLIATSLATAAAASPPGFKTLYTAGKKADGLGIGPIAYRHGTLYGVTVEGGRADQGTLFAFDLSSASETVLTSFTINNLNGFNPVALGTNGPNLVVANLFGGVGANQGDGTLYRYNTATGAQGKLFDFAEIDPGCFATAVQIFDGTLYGTCPASAGDYGIVFAVAPHGGKGRVLFTFQDGAEGGYPAGPLVWANGTLYGAVQSVNGDGVGGLFRLNTATGNETVIHRFAQVTEGGDPAGIVACGGVFYGFNAQGGVHGGGTAWAFDLASQTASTLYAFKSGTDSQQPFAPAPVCFGRYLYGTAANGGAHGDGTVFRIDRTAGKETIVHQFAGNDGAYPIAGLIRHGDVLFGSTDLGPLGGGVGLAGTLFEITP